MQVTFFQRKRRPNANYSLEFIFEDVRRRLIGLISSRVVTAPFYSNGLIRRFGISISAWWHQGEITHVTGDINFAASFLSRRHTVLTILDCGFLERTRGIRRSVLRQFWLRLPVRRATIVTTISTAAQSDIIRHTGCDPQKVIVIPVAVSEQFRPLPRQNTSGIPRILQIGTAPNKNVPRVVRALKGIPCVFVVVGQLHAEIAHAVAESGVDVENHVDLSNEQILDQYHRADVVVFASLYEGFGMPIVEAQAVGRPVVTSNLSSMPEVAGDAACLVNPHSTESIREGIQRVLTDAQYSESLVQKGYVNAKRFDPEVIARQYYQVYLRLVDSSSR